MSFDQIDRQFRPKPRIELECARCGSTHAVTLTPSLWHAEDEERIPLCEKCYILEIIPF